MIQKKYTNNDILTIKLQSGEEIVGKFETEDIGSITLSKPLMLGMTQKGPGWAPVLMTVDQEKPLTFAKNCIAITAPTYHEIAQQYLFQTTGIQPVTAGSIIT